VAMSTTRTTATIPARIGPEIPVEAAVAVLPEGGVPTDLGRVVGTVDPEVAPEAVKATT
jgi:hypothetical protein